MSLFGSLVAAVLIVFLFRQTASAHRERDRAVVARACEAVSQRYAFYTAGMETPPPDTEFDAGLRAVLLLALRRNPHIAGGIGPADAAPHATVGAVPLSLVGTIRTEIAAALAEDRPVVATEGGFVARSTIAACPLGGPVSNLAAYVVLRADLLRSQYTRIAFGGLAVLLATLLASAGFLARLVLGFSRRLAGVEAALAADPPGPLPLTGEAELDRLIAALNAATFRLDAARARIAEAERLAALGRMAAGLAHEIRNPLGAIRLRAEGTREGDAARHAAALDRILAEAARLEALTTRLLDFAATSAVHKVPTSLSPLLAEAAAAQTRASTALVVEPTDLVWPLDPVLTGRALSNLLRNAMEACSAGDTVTLAATVAEGGLRIAVADTGPGIDPAIGDPFEPFVTGRADGIGLGLAIARDMIRAQGGTLVMEPVPRGACFVITLPEMV